MDDRIVAEITAEGLKRLARVAEDEGVTLIGADLGCQASSQAGRTLVEPSPLFTGTVAALAPVGAHIALQRGSTVLLALPCPRPWQHRAHLLTTEMRQRPLDSAPSPLLLTLLVLVAPAHSPRGSRLHTG